jgi:hypothetical protein
MENTVTEEKLLAALDNLEKGEKSDKGTQKMPKDAKAANGGLSKVGKEPEESVSAAEGDKAEGGKVAKAEPPPDETSTGEEDGTTPDSSSTEEGSDSASEESSSSESSEEAPPPPKKGKKVKKAEGAESSSSSSSTKGKKAKKSFMRDAMDNSDLRKAIDASPYLESLTDELGGHVDGLSSRVKKAFRSQEEFNGRLAKAIIAVGNQQMGMQAELLKAINGVKEILDAIGNAPAAGRKTVLHKSEIVERPVADAMTPEATGLEGMSKAQVTGCLAALVAKGVLRDSKIVTAFECGSPLPKVVADRIAKGVQDGEFGSGLIKAQ